MPKVVTTDGAVHTPPHSKDGRTLTLSAAEAIAAEANRKAEALGIKTRYEVRDE